MGLSMIDGVLPGVNGIETPARRCNRCVGHILTNIRESRGKNYFSPIMR